MQVNIFNAIVVGNSGLRGEIEVYIPSMMTKMEPETLKPSQKSATPLKNRVSSSSGKASEMGVNFSINNTILAKPLFMNSHKEEGTYLVPEVGSLVSTFYINNDQTECYYLFNGAADQKNDTYILDFESLINSTNASNPDTKPNIKVLLRMKNNSVIAFDTNPDKNSFIVRVNNGHFIEVQDGKISGIRMETKSGNVLNMNDQTKVIDMTNGSATYKMTGGNIYLN